jgi:benzil reductase ((S)-benzoin forming)
MNTLTILTGASRGMGLAIAEQLLDAGHYLVCMARNQNQQLVSRAQITGASLEQWTLDLAHGADAAARLEQWLQGQKPEAWQAVHLINNAGVIANIAPLRQADPADLNNALRVGLEAPMQLTAAFLRATAHWPGARKVLNISSGLGRRAMASQAAYCAAKAGMDHFTRCVALDEASQPNGAKLCSLAPGVIATDMQVQLRSADSALFPDSANFVAMHDNGVLATPEQAATRILAYLARADFGNEPVADVRG